ncbi:DUF3299 domain-containing protein [Rhodobacteraceae bacterium LMO-12]|nr:DUF3299 domain-containing protein [Rhodobacteraceae bacterium LMO-JJ12]
MQTTRRMAMSGLVALSALALANPVAARSVQQIGWADLIPEGVPPAEIIGEGMLDEANDIWRPVFDKNANRFVTALNGAQVRMPGFMLPLQTSGSGVTEFILVPYAGACIHVPPPPPNQLVFVTSKRPWNAQVMFEPVWVTGTIMVDPISTNLADIGYSMRADLIELYEWK